MLGRSISTNSLVLGIFAFVTAGLLALIYSVTEARIDEQKQKAAEKALLEIVPRDRHDNAMLDTLWTIPENLLSELGHKNPENIHIALNQGNPVAIILPATAPDGYSGDIELLIGINTDGSIAGVRVLKHKETPGLGDKIDLNKSDWLLSFNNLSLTAPNADSWAVKKDGGHFDQFTGATITPRAVVRQVKGALEFYSKHHEKILNSELYGSKDD